MIKIHKTSRDATASHLRHEDRLNHWLLTIIIGLLLFTCPPAHATLILGIPTAEGMLVVSDKLGHSKLSGFYNTFDKVVPINSHAAMAAAGMAAFGSTKRAGTNFIFLNHFNAWDLARTYFLTNPIEEFDGLDFADCMARQFSDYFVAKKMNADAVAEDPCCQFILFQLKPDTERRIFVSTLFFKKSGTGLAIKTDCRQAVQRNNDFAHIWAFGISDLAVELAKGHDPKYDQLRHDPLLAKFLRHPPRIYDVRLAEARLFADRLMAESSARSKFIGTNWNETFLRCQ